MHTYCRLKNGIIMIVWSDNTEEETMDLYSLKFKDDFDVEFDPLPINVPYSEIDRTNKNLTYLQNL